MAASLLLLLLLLSLSFEGHRALREFRSWSTRSSCDKAADPNYPFAYSKYAEQVEENKARVNSNKQDFRHGCTNRGGRSKCHICEDIICNSTYNRDPVTRQGQCFLQLQGVDATAMSQNIPTVTDTAWAVGGKHRKDFGGRTVSHFCVMTSYNGYNQLTGQKSNNCIKSSETNFDGCTVRCFGYFGYLSTGGYCSSDVINSGTCNKAKPAVHLIAPNATLIDKYAGMGRWSDDGQVDVWVYPRNCTELSTQYNKNCTYSGTDNHTPSFNPQGFSFSRAGSGRPGFKDGPHDKAMFQSPEDVAVDVNGIIYVADTMNNAIRMIDSNGFVTTIAGKGSKVKGDLDGDCKDATFAEPKGLDVTIQNGKVVIIVADTANHRIRRIDYVSQTNCRVKCLTGLCGNNTISATDYKQKASPYSGYADGNGTEARFSAPESVAIMHNTFIAVADTGNFLIRLVYLNNGTTITLAGKVIPGLVDNSGRPLPGCQPPCMAAQSGFKDGNLKNSSFLNPVDVTPGPGTNSLYVADDHRIRMIELPNVISTIYGIASSGRVSTVAGNAIAGTNDGLETEATFFNPQGVFVTRDGIGYVVDQGSCRVRRITPLPIIANVIIWSTAAVSLIRPSGCTSFEQPYDKSGYKVTRTEKTLQYNLGYPYLLDPNHGRYIKNCVGVPPRDVLQKHFLSPTSGGERVSALATAPLVSAKVVSGKRAGVTTAAANGTHYLNITVTDGPFAVGMQLSGAGIPIGTLVTKIYVIPSRLNRFRLRTNNAVKVFNNTKIYQYTRTVKVNLVSGNWSRTGVDLYGSNIPSGTFVTNISMGSPTVLTLNNQVFLSPSTVLTQSTYEVDISYQTTISPAPAAPIWQTGMLVNGSGIPADTYIGSINAPTKTSTKLRLTLTRPVHLVNNTILSGYGDNMVIDDHRTSINEDSEEGMAITVQCVDNCATLYTYYSSGQNKFKFRIEGYIWYSEDSSVCMAAKHANILPNCIGYVRLTFQRYDYLRNLRLTQPTLGTAYTLVDGTKQWKSTAITSDKTYRIFSMEARPISGSVVHTVGGGPSAPLQGGCGFFDAQPSTLSYFNKPSGLAARPISTSLGQNDFMYIADTTNHRIRAMSVSCTLICENGGTCTGPDVCDCTGTGFTGVDCTQPVCGTTTQPLSCGANKVCVGNNLCGCKPGFGGVNCDKPQCVQTCQNNAICSAPDTCTCQSGWFDSNCTTPVCSATCANGGNCTAPNTCSCPDQWAGSDCRIPLCKQTCNNGGYCVAPDTCACPPQYTNFDCSAPVCSQGYFVPNDKAIGKYPIFTNKLKAEGYRPCNLQQWCNSTQEFECDQPTISYDTIAVPSGGAYRKKTGRASKPNLCMNIEVYPSLVTPYELIYAATDADGVHITTGVRRYSPLTPYVSDDRNPERGFYKATPDKTGPWTYSTDRQIANVAWYNVTQGVYVCANKGHCVKPDICQCADGWMGFDCRTPICSQGYYQPDQKDFVSSGKTPGELERFFVFMKDVTTKTLLNGSYSNPNYTIQSESYAPDVNGSVITRQIQRGGGVRYNTTKGFQGGYRCSIRAYTEWENFRSDVFSHPNYYSRYMDNKTELDGITYTFWHNMHWPAVHHKSRVLDTFPIDNPNPGAPPGTLKDANYPCDKGASASSAFDECYFDPNKLNSIPDTAPLRGQMRNIPMQFANTNEGWRRRGEWNRTANNWEYGVCIVQFFRNCSGAPYKQYDLHFKQHGKTVMETDISYRPRITFNDFQVIHHGRWNIKGGECVDQVQRGCFNNGTCVRPGVCQCADGWSGSNCSIPVCKIKCEIRNGNCTGPNQCTCEKGWKGEDCLTPICAQDCMNGGKCVAPDTCQCYQWPNAFRDGRLNGGRPLFQDPNGFPLKTGWTGFDCATPICVQSEKFYTVVQNPRKVPGPKFKQLGGHGGDNQLTCIDAVTLKVQPRCPQFDVYNTGNEGLTYQAGCGWDPYDSGCCVDDPNTIGNVICYKCPDINRVRTNHTYFCSAELEKTIPTVATTSDLSYFWINPPNHNLRFCGRHHNPRYHDPLADPEDMGRVRYYTDFLFRPEYSNRNYLNTLTSNSFLCNVEQWTQGDYIDEGGLGPSTKTDGVGSIYALEKGRHVRINYANMQYHANNGTFTAGDIIRGEGLFGCRNLGSCIAPDICSCKDGYEGYDCNTPQCRHLQPSGQVSACNNGGICSSRDSCDCVQVPSMLSSLYKESPSGTTGWSGSDCTMPMCIQGFYDPFCTDLPEAPGGEGCYRCSNGGNCTAPDVCKCAEGWSGYDCKTPLCSLVADPLTRTQLATTFEDKVMSFEKDPCGYEALYGVNGWKGTKYARGNCSQPNVCTCLCKDVYNPKKCKKTGYGCNGPWQDPLVNYRNVLTSRTKFPGSWIFGSTDCAYGYEGNVDKLDRFTSCHLTIYIPSTYEKSTVQIIVGIALSGFITAVLYYFIAARLRQRFLLAKIERRRSKRSSEESLLRNSFSDGRSSSVNRKSSS